MRKMTVAQTIREREREIKRQEILSAFNTITREEVLAMLESFIEKGIITVSETKTKVKVNLHRCCTSFHFYDKVLRELYRTSESHTTQKETVKFKITDAIIQVTF